MNVIFDFNSSWYVLFFGFLAAWALLLIIRRKGPAKREAKEQVFLATSEMIALSLRKPSPSPLTFGITRLETGL